jgi:hypothetical protein
MGSMVAVAFFGLFSASIFIVHTVDAYRALNRSAEA